MGFLYIIFVGMNCFGFQDRNVPRHDFESMVDEILEPYPDIRFDFESKAYRFENIRGVDEEHLTAKPEYITTGSFAYRRDLSFKVVRQRELLGKVPPILSTFSYTNGRSQFSSSNPANPGRSITISKISVNNLNIDFPPGLLMPMIRLKLMLKNTRATIRQLDDDFIDHELCSIFLVEFNGVIKEKYWIGQDRKVVLLWEQSTPRGLTKRVGGYRFVKKKIGASKEFWAPVFAKIELYNRFNEKMKTDDPTFIEILSVPIATLDLENPVLDKDLIDTIKIGDVVNDRFKKRKYEYGQDMRPAPKNIAEEQKRLDETLEKAKNQGQEVIAQSWTNSKNSWYRIIPLACSCVLALILLVIQIKKYRDTR
jgi:hypothetical protein